MTVNLLRYVCLSLIALAAPAIAEDGPTTQPTSISSTTGAAMNGPGAATQPAGGGVRGKVGFGRSLDLQKPDISRAIVYLAANAALDAQRPAKATATMAQRNKSFVPNLL